MHLDLKELFVAQRSLQCFISTKVRESSLIVLTREMKKEKYLTLHIIAHLHMNRVRLYMQMGKREQINIPSHYESLGRKALDN